MALYAVGGNRPRIHQSSFVHPLAAVMGRVEIGPGCYIAAGAVLRGDWVTIRVGAGSNVQEGCVIHGYPGEEVVLEEDSHLGHGCVVHSAHVGRNCLVGMNATVTDGAELGESSIVGAGALVPMGMKVPAGMLVMGVPAKVVGEVRPELAEEKRGATRWYQELAKHCLEEFEEVDLTAGIEAGAADSGWRPWIERTELFRFERRNM